MSNRVTYNKPVTPELAKMIELLLEQHLGVSTKGRVIFAPRLKGDESIAFKFVGGSRLEPEVNAEIRIMWRDL